MWLCQKDKGQLASSESQLFLVFIDCSWCLKSPNESVVMSWRA